MPSNPLPASLQSSEPKGAARFCARLSFAGSQPDALYPSLRLFLSVFPLPVNRPTLHHGAGRFNAYDEASLDFPGLSQMLCRAYKRADRAWTDRAKPTSSAGCIALSPAFSFILRSKSPPAPLFHETSLVVT